MLAMQKRGIIYSTASNLQLLPMPTSSPVVPERVRETLQSCAQTAPSDGGDISFVLRVGRFAARVYLDGIA